MGSEKRKEKEWAVFLQSGAMTLWMYLVGIFLLAFLIVNGILPERVSVGGVGVLCLFSSTVGGVIAANRSSLGKLPAAVVNAGFFAGVLVVVGAMGWTELFWGEYSVVLLICVLGGGVVAGLWSARRRRRKGGKKTAVFAK